ncbi:MAG TPA: ABC transporter permease, partial [Thermoanaerobaculia bacterium]|nr:ABC transporter permease [Thermoanaerobaculia bacterium]
MIGQAIRLAARKAVRYPALSAVTFLTLAIGIAVSATIFSVAWTMLVRPFVFANQNDLVILWANDATGHVPKLELSYEEVEQLQKESKTLTDIAPHCAANFQVVARRRAGEPATFASCTVGEAFFRALGIQPAIGRTFRPEEHKPGAEVAAMLSHDAWVTRFGADPSIVDDTLSGGGVTVTIVGVLPQHLNLPNRADLIIPLEPGMQERRMAANRVLTAIARVRPGARLEQVNSELAVISSHVDRAHPEAREATLVAHPLVDEILGPARHAVRILLGMGVLVLVIAILNIASISVAQGVGRFDELGVRSSVGATRGRTALQLFIEFGALALLAAAAGIALAAALLRLLMRLAPPTVPRLTEVSLGWETVAFAVGAAIVAAMVAALMQLVSASEETLLRSLRTASRSASGRASRRFLELLAVGQVAVAIVTVVVASLLVDSFRKFA